MSFGSHDGVQLYGSSASSNSRESRSWMRGNNSINHQFMVSDGVGPYYSSPSDVSPAQQWTPPAVQEIATDEYGTSRRDVAFRPLPFSPTMEGTSAARDSAGSTSSRSDSSFDNESTLKSNSSHRNFPSRHCFMSKAIHPLSYPPQTPPIENSHFTPAILPTTPQREGHHSPSVSLDLSEIPFEHDLSNSPSNCLKCGLCDRLLSQRSPFSSRRIVKSGDMPVSGVLSCRHVFHAECLDQTTPKARRNDPPCPICVKIEEEGPTGFFKVRNSGPSGPSKNWGPCGQAGDCVEGARKNTLMSLNRGRFRKNLSLKGNLGREYHPGKVKKSGSFSSQLFIGSSSKTREGSSLK